MYVRDGEKYRGEVQADWLALANAWRTALVSFSPCSRNPGRKLSASVTDYR